MGGHAHHTGARVVCVLQVVDGADAGQQQGGDLRVLHHVGGGFDPFQIGVGAETVVEAGALKAVAVGHFDGVDFRQIEGAGNRLNVIERVLVADRVHAVAQGDVGDIEFLAVHGSSPQARIDCAMRSAVASAAEVMMSRLPA
ncbi:hypothetical protein D3C78_1385750 [compost metagenome]